MTSNGRRTQNIKSGISQQPLIGSSSNFKLKLIGPNQNFILLIMKMTYKGRRPQNIKSGISQQPLMDLPQILNLSSGNQTKIENSSK